MKSTILIIFFFSCSLTFSQLSILQSDSEINWHKIENKNFKILFPEYLEPEAQYTLNLLNYYRPIVGARYYSQPEKITITLRPDMATPNGFVTLAPRRSEWFNSKNIAPIIGSLDWFQSLAIHEYRHIVQYDHLSKGNTKWGYYLFGEQALGVLLQIVMPNWYFEGDAVWAETILSDGGRGRSPRFSARFKALLTSNQIPTYDDLLAGDYEHSYPGIYIYGYFLIARAAKIYGPDFWVSLSEYAADRPWNPFTFTSSFLALTGERFDKFYEESLIDLRSKWETPPKNFLTSSNDPYSNSYFPFKSGAHLYYLKQEFNERLSLYKNDKKLRELNIDPSLSAIDFKNEKLLFAMEDIHYRYLYKNYSNLYWYDSLNDQLFKITKDEKYFHPKWHPTKNLIMAVHRDNKDKYSIHILDTNGKIQSHYTLDSDRTISQTSWIDENRIAAIILNRNGTKQLAVYDLKDKNLKLITPESRNNLFNISAHKNQIFFEADYKAKVQIFKIDLTDKNFPLSKCSDEYISALMPSLSLDEKDPLLSYVWESPQGKRIKTTTLNCSALSHNNLFQIENYISAHDPSDNYHQTKPVIVENFNQFFKKNYQKSYYSESTNSFRPHSWSIFADRGFQISASAQNELGSLSLYGATGIISAEGTPFMSAEISYMKFFPILSFNVDQARRHLKIKDQFSNWNESKFSAQIILPYFYQNDFFNGAYFFNLSQGLIKVSENDYQIEEKLNAEDLITHSIGFSASYAKSLTKQEIISKWSYHFDINYMNLKSNKSDRFNYFGQYALSLTTPALKRNHGMLFNFTSERRPNNESLYQLQTSYVPTIAYTFSRGYLYEFTSKFEKISLDYYLPLTYPKTGFRDWLYITRIYSKIFYDTTKLKNLELFDRTLNSKGIEFIIDTNTMRKFAISYGFRILHKELDDQVSLEFFFANMFI